LHWSGDPFSYQGTHFDAREVIGLPRPIQQPIPVWIGGNSALTLRRVAARAQGWLPLLSYTDISVTTRTPNIGSVDELAAKIKALREQAGDRAAGLDVAAAYNDPTIWDPQPDVARHRDVFARMQDAGVTWFIVSAPADRARAFIDAFAEQFLKA
jgi:alkanesulfonate monooxygenase SsuD/methylene tetrahydromethanopterin reductase-like flavin-dependent oxidoreductase (luciferase family)